MSSAKRSDPFPLIKGSKIFDALSETNKKLLARHAVLVHPKKNNILWRRQDPGDFCAAILEGLVEIVNANPAGEESTLGLFGPKDIVGLSAILHRSSYPATAKVVGRDNTFLKLYIRSIDSETPKADRDNMLTWQRERLLHHEQILRDKINILGAGRASRRLLELFSHLQMRFSEDTTVRAPKVFLPLALTKTQLARLIDARVETTIRILNKWERTGHFKVEKNGITLKKLDQLREEDEP